MLKSVESISVFFPSYNEEGNVAPTVTSTKKVLQKVADKWEIIIVNDGSKDNTRKVAEEMAKTDKRIRVVNHKKNKGYGGALKTGFSSAKYKWVAFADVDGQFDFEEIKEFIKHQDDADLIVGFRKSRADSFMRKLYTAVWSHILPRILLGLKVRDYSCGFKMIKKEVYEKVLPLKGEEKVTQLEMLTKAQRLGYRFVEIGVNHYPRKFGEQTGANLKVVLRSVRDLIKLWWQLRK